MRMSMRKPYPHFPFIDDYYRKKINMSLERLKMFEPPEGYYLAFSGGKDSCVVKKLCDIAAVKYDAHYNNTSIDPPELVRFIKEHHRDVIHHKQKKGLLRYMAEDKTMPPLRQVRWCCEIYKEGGGTGRIVLTGIRWAESSKRSSRRMTEECLKDGTKHYVHPIIDWYDNEVWMFLKETNTPYCSLYDEGRKRIGCIMCPMARKSERLADRERYQKFENAFRIAFRKLYNKNKAAGKDLCRWKDGDEMFEWWLNG